MEIDAAKAANHAGYRKSVQLTIREEMMNTMITTRTMTKNQYKAVKHWIRSVNRLINRKVITSAR